MPFPTVHHSEEKPKRLKGAGLTEDQSDPELEHELVSDIKRPAGNGSKRTGGPSSQDAELLLPPPGSGSGDAVCWHSRAVELILFLRRPTGLLNTISFLPSFLLVWAVPGGYCT